MRTVDVHCATSVKDDAFGPTVTLPNHSTITADRIAQLPLSDKLSTNAQTAHVLPGLTTSTLLSVGKLCDDDCDVIFRRDDVQILKNKNAVSAFLSCQRPIIKGKRNYSNKLWDITLPQPIESTPRHQIVLPVIHGALYSRQLSTTHSPSVKQQKPKRKMSEHYNNIFADMDQYIDLAECDYIVQHQLKEDRINMPRQQATLSPSDVSITPINHHLNVILRKDEHKTDLMNYLHGCCFWLVKSTFLKAIKNNHFTYWPGLDAELVNRHLTTNINTVKGHLKQERQGLQSTGYKDKLREIRAKLARLKEKILMQQ